MRLHQESGITKLSWNPTSPFLYTAGLDGAIRVIDARSCTIEKLLGRHKTEVLDMAVTKYDRYSYKLTSHETYFYSLLFLQGWKQAGLYI